MTSQFNFTLIYSTPWLPDSIPLLRRSAPCRSLSIHRHRTSPPRLSAPYYSHITPTVNTSLQYSPLTLILPPCFSTLSTLWNSLFYPAGFSPFFPQNLFRGVTPPVRSAAPFRPGALWTIHPKTVNITPYFTVNRPCPCAAHTQQPLKNQGFSVFVPKMLFFGTLTEIYIVYKTEIVYNPFRNYVVDGG